MVFKCYEESETMLRDRELLGIGDWWRERATLT